LAKETLKEVEDKTDKSPAITVHELCIINGHRNYLYILFYNLLQNAIKFNESDRPLVDVYCEKVILEDASALSTVAEYYKVTIADNGIGFEDANKERIFTIFEKLHGHAYKGSGIGLTIAKKIMDAHNGFITAESIAGKGSSFHCYFPISA
jgi:signal transduction histidine kinase